MISLLALIAFLSSDEDWQQSNAAFRKPGRCGVNALYVLLKASEFGREPGFPSYQDFESTVKYTENGSSLEELRQGAADLGFECSVAKIKQGDLWTLPLPILLHLDTVDQGGAGHFVVLHINHKAGNTQIIDGASGMETWVSKAELERMFSGFVLFPPAAYDPSAQQRKQWLKTAAWALAAICMVVGVSLYVRRVR